jgi:hypothetical protein
LTDAILFGALENGGTVTLGLDGDRLAFSYAPLAAPLAAPPAPAGA